jgi:hypothetical protein
MKTKENFANVETTFIFFIFNLQYHYYFAVKTLEQHFVKR